MLLSVSVRRLCGGYSQCGTSAGPPDFVVQNYRKIFNRPNYTYYYIRHFLFFLVSWGLWNTFCLFLISFSHRYTFHSACRNDIPLPRHLSVHALIPSSPFWPMKPVLSKSYTLRFRTAFLATAAFSVATSAAPGLSIVTHPKGLPDSNNSRTRIQNLLDEYKSTNAQDSFIWLSIMRYP